MCDSLHTLGTRHFPGLVIEVKCDGVVYVLDQRDRDPMRPFGLRRFAPTTAPGPIEPLTCQYGGQFAAAQTTVRHWLDSMTRAHAEDIAVLVVTEPTPLITDAPVMGEPTYFKCAHCHLFVEPNDEYRVGSGLSMYVHLHRGDDADEALISTHDAWPLGEPRTIAEWKRVGVEVMRERFTDAWSNDPDRTTRKGLTS